MESTVEENSKGIDASVGGLVWVRRRNGSWWPGRIMGLDELSETCLVSPRSGTPVKLLGREDASVDWYNIEKSKRVKAFRCGEYDECIEKAKASAALANKKAVKYARREDAILHALDLESARKIMEHQAFCSRTENSIGKSIGLSKEKRAYVGNFNMLEENSAQELSLSVVSFEQTNHVSAPNIHFIHKSKRKTPNDSEDDGTEGTKRMRGLQDLVPPDSASLSEPNIGNSLSNGIPVNNIKGCCSILKRRRSQVSQVHESFKRKNRRRPLTKVLESTAKVDITGFCDANTGLFALEVITESKNGAMESTESKKTSSSTVIDNNSNCTETSCEKENSLNDSRRICDDGVDAVHWYTKDNTFPGMLEFPNNDCSVSILNAHSVKEENRNGVFSDAFASCASRKLRSGAAGRRSSHSNRNEPKSLRKGLDEVGSTSFSYVANNAKQRTEKNASKWQSKRKRNSGCLSKKTSENPYSRHFFMYGANRSHRRKNGLSIGFYSKVDNNSFEESLTSDNDDGDQVFDTHDQISDELASHSLKSTMRKSAAQTRKKASFLARGLPVLSGIHQRSNFHCQYLVPENPKAGASIGFPLFDVNLDVRGSYQGQHVPLVSLMSKLNGKAIIGHPITVEVLEDGYYEFLMSSINHHPASNNAELYNIPRIEENASEQSADIFNPSIALGGSDDAVGTCENASSSLSKKSPKNRRCGFLSQKTRKLSSIAVDHELKDEERNLVVAKLGEPVISCVPVKIVFSRIKEAVSCSARPANRILTSNPL